MTQKDKFKVAASSFTSPPIPKTPVLKFPASMLAKYPELIQIQDDYNAQWEEFQKQLRLIG